jgi:hypothetical protein
MEAHIDDSHLRNVGIKSMSRAIKYRDCMIQGNVNHRASGYHMPASPLTTSFSLLRNSVAAKIFKSRGCCQSPSGQNPQRDRQNFRTALLMSGARENVRAL